MDRILIRDITAYCIVGIMKKERATKQRVLINVTLECDLSTAAESDEIEDTIDYKTVKDEIIAMVEASGFFLVEKMARTIIDICLRDARVKRVTVSVDKPDALTRARSVAVEMTRGRE